MQFRRLAIAALLATSPFPALAHKVPPPGIWTNTEDEYFADEEGREKPDWVAIEVGDDGNWRRIDAFGSGISDWSDTEIPGLTFNTADGWQLGGSELRRARPFFCWVSVRKFTAKPDGTEDWTFVRNLANFDQGGRIKVPGEGIAPDVTIRLRNVTWARGSRNKPSLVLYVHKQDPIRAESYSWAAPQSTMIGINLRWVQASCSRTPSEAKGS